MNAALRPLDAFRLLRDERCTETATQRLATFFVVLRTDNATWEAQLSMTTLATDMGVSRRCAVNTVTSLVDGGEGFPIGLRKQRGRKVMGHRREANTYTLFIREGWALSLYLNGAPPSLVNDVHQSIGDLRAPTLVNQVHTIGDLRAQVLPSSASDLPQSHSRVVFEISKAIRTHAIFNGLDADALARGYELEFFHRKQKVEWVVAAIGDCALKKAGVGLNNERLQSALVGFMKNAKAPRATGTADDVEHLRSRSEAECDRAQDEEARRRSRESSVRPTKEQLAKLKADMEAAESVRSRAAAVRREAAAQAELKRRGPIE